ncbi:MAG TPA: hypothetical protein VF698_05935 [Thermoanaerobaculia bacterium]|jgi:hypothetical protein
MRRIAPLLLFFALACHQGHESTDTAPAATASESSATATATDTTGSAATATTASTAPASGACALVTPEDLNRITGMTFGAGQETASGGDISKCVFTATGGGQATLTIALHQSDASKLYNIMPGMASITGNGIGDQAWWSPQVSSLVSLKNGKTLHIAFNGVQAQQGWAEEIARIITPKM